MPGIMVNIIPNFMAPGEIHPCAQALSPRESIERYLTLLKIREYFELIVSGAEFKNSKPDPEIYRYTIKKLHATAAECLVVEDSIYGIIAAKQAGAVVAAKKRRAIWTGSVGSRLYGR